jgi:hypothetical protein
MREEKWVLMQKSTLAHALSHFVRMNVGHALIK